jgi:GDP-L-fucose synthase
MDRGAKVYIAGHTGLVGSALLRHLRGLGYQNIVTRTREEMDLTDSVAVKRFFSQELPEYVFLAAGRVGGILANSTYPAEFIRDNLLIHINVLEAAYRTAARKVLVLGSSCIYPKFAPQPIREDALLTGELEPTNQWYAVAKIAGIKTAQAYRRQYGCHFICAMPTNLYGPGDNFDLESSHVLPALLRKFHEAKSGGASSVVVWGTGKPRRELLYVDDLAGALCFLIENWDSEEIINIGTGVDVTILELAALVGDVVGYHGEIVLDGSKPDGTPRRVLDVSRLFQLGWRPTTPLRQGLERTYRWYVDACLSTTASLMRQSPV